MLILEIGSSVLKVANKKKEVRWKDIIADLYDLIKESYDGKSIKVYRGDWKRRIKLVIKSMGYRLENFDDDVFVPLDTTKKPESFSTKSTGSNYKLSDCEKKHIVDNFNKVPTTEKRILSTGKAVDDVMKNLAQESVYEHPVHSIILVPDDPVWKNHFTNDELNEIRSFHLTPLPNIPNDIEQYLAIYEEDWKSAKELYKFADDQKHDPVDEFHLKWIRESFMRAAELFFYDDTLTLNDYSEADLLHEVWSFVYRAFKDRQIKAALGEKSNITVALGKNKERRLEAVEKRTRKAIGAKVDILFKVCKDEIGSFEVGNYCVTS